MQEIPMSFTSFYDWTQGHLAPMPRRYHVTPVCLVPNGRAHLGHIAGPLLKADILNRSLKVAGHESLLISCTDPDELHVVIKAMSRGENPEEMASMFHRQIDEDCKRFDIDFDEFIDPHGEKWQLEYEKINRTLIDDLLANGHAVIRSEKMPVLLETGDGYVEADFVPKPGDYLVGGWISGECNWCKNRMVGFFCEACGAHCNHEDVAGKESVYFEARFEERDCSSIFLQTNDVAAVLSHLERMGFNTEFLKIVERYTQDYGGTIRLTLPSKWGVQYSHDALFGSHAIFTYSGVLYGCHILAGEAYRRLSGDAGNPLDKMSDVVNVLTFGIDNTIPFAFGVTALGLTNPRYKPIDRLYANHFYNLDGSKFSTSRGHVIWGGDIAAIEDVNTDFLRQYLTETAPENAVGNFDLDEFVVCYNDVAKLVRGIVVEVETAGRITTGPNDERMASLARTWLIAFSETYALDGFTMQKASAFTRKVLQDLASLEAKQLSPDSIKLAAIMLHPIMPRLSLWLWQAAGQHGPITLSNSSAATFLVQTRTRPVSSVISLSTLKSCLPDALKQARGL